MKIYSLQSLRFELALACCLTILSTTSSAQSFELDPVTVTASKFEESVLSTPAHLTIITQEDIRQSGVATVNDAVMRLGGVTGRPSQQGGAEFTLDIMGFGDTAMLNTVIVIDGIPIREADQSESRLSGIPIDQVVRIEILRGAASVVYGEGAAAGVINILTKASGFENRKSGMSGSVSVGNGSYGLQEQRANLDINQEELTWSFSGLRRASDGERSNSNSTNESFSSSVQFRSTDIRSGVYANIDNADSKLPGPFYTLEDFRLTPLVASTPGDWSKSQTNRLGFFAEKTWAETLFKIDVNQRNRELNSFLNSTPRDVQSKYSTKANFLSVSANQFLEKPTGNFQAIYGLEIYNWDQTRRTDATSNNTQDIQSQSTSLFGKIEQQFRSTGTLLNGGVRTEKLSRTSQSSLTSSDYGKQLYASEVGISQRITDHFNAYGRIAQSYRSPNADEFACALGYPCSNSNTLKPQISSDFEAGLKYAVKDQLRLSSRFYTSLVTHEIAYNPDASINSNMSPTTRSGVDLNAIYKPHPSIYVGANMGFRQSVFRDGINEGNVIPMAPEQVASIQADWQFVSNHSVGIGWTGIGKQYFTGNFSNDPQFVVPAYGLTDLRYRYKANEVELVLSVNNLADKKFYSYGTMYGGGYYAIYPDLGRTWMVRLKYQFQ
jgi:iron complex outermembrane receptor protein